MKNVQRNGAGCISISIGNIRSRGILFKYSSHGMYTNVFKSLLVVNIYTAISREHRHTLYTLGLVAVMAKKKHFFRSQLLEGKFFPQAIIIVYILTEISQTSLRYFLSPVPLRF
jgi:hypothetical protein